MSTRLTRLTWIAAALPVANVLHAVTPGHDDQMEAIAGPIMGTVLTIAAVVALVGLVRDRQWAPRFAAAVGLATIAGFVLFHAFPVRTEVTEPYWGDGAATALQWLSLAVIGGVAAWLVREAVVAGRTGDARPA
jgi:drug/metabolite transporter (DMT)-like permease